MFQMNQRYLEKSVGGFWVESLPLLYKRFKMYTIKVESHFNAAHNLRGYQGKCEKLHGHNWKVEVEIQAKKLNKIEMVCDFKIVKKNLESVLRKLDHSYLNKNPFFKKHNPTSERIAEFIYNSLKKSLRSKLFSLKSVSVWETQSCSATYREDNG